MSPFPILDPYARDGDGCVAILGQRTNDATESDSDGFKIDSDVSDEDLLLLKAELMSTKSTKTQRNLAATFKAFLIWYRQNHPQAVRLNTFESLWKGIRQLYYDNSTVPVNDSISKEVSTWLNGPFCTKYGLARGSLPKYTVGYNGILGALCYHWISDTEKFPLERDRVQLALFILLLAYTGARPGAIVESDVAGIRQSNEALKYRDIQLKLVRPSGAAPLLIMKVRITLDKGRRHRGESKTLTLYENCVQPVMCPIVYFLALAFTDNAFHPELVEAGLFFHLSTLRWSASTLILLLDAGVSEPQLLQILGHRKI
ncbi:MAG: hypothetical protein Q9207_003690 [Kuettlingeria erythrocarpa]